MDNTIPPIPLQKQCKGCKNTFPCTSEYFHAQKAGKYGFRSTCKVCRRTETPPEARKVYRQKYREEHLEEIKQHSKEYARTHTEEARKRRQLPHNMEKHRQESREYARQHSEERKLYAHKYYRENIERFTEYKKVYNTVNAEKVKFRSKVYYNNNKASVDAKSRQYYRTHKAQHRVHSHAYRARKRTAEGKFTSQDIQRQLVAQKNTCYWCSKKLEKYEVDHIIPLTRGGTNDPSNLVIACPWCNNSKHNKLPHEWIQGGRLL
jgi:5-methylcytosine-specific restriction endonuclease McrA